MSNTSRQHEPGNQAAAPLRLALLKNIVPLCFSRLAAIRTWTSGHWWRRVVVAGVILSLIVITMIGWAYLASVALRAGEPTIDLALEVLDEGRHEEARLAVDKMLKSGRLPRSEYGGPLFVLGAVKVHDAENQARADRRRIEYLVASRYLKEAEAHGFPADRAVQGAFLLGKTLIESGQFEEGLRTLNELLAEERADEPIAVTARRLVAETCLTMPHPNLEEALRHYAVLAAQPDISQEERAADLLRRAECLARLERFGDARQTLAEAEATGAAPAGLALMSGKIELDDFAAALERTAVNGQEKLVRDASPRIAKAIRELQKAEQLEPRNLSIVRQTSYHLGRCFNGNGDKDQALQQFARTRQFHGDSFEGLAAALAEADLLRERGELEAALVAYRRVLDAYSEIPVYRSYVLPLAEFRQRLMAALKDLVDRQHFAEAIVMLEHFEPLFSRAETLELRGGTLERWGNLMIGRSEDDSLPHNDHRKQALHHLRAAGVAFQQLADARFATSLYTSDLWRAAENYYKGQNFTRTVRLLDEYLRYEPQRRNAEALLRLGQAHLALGQIPESIAAFEECIEFHPLDSSTFQARLDCAKAHWHRGDAARAEQLLRENIAGSTLLPTSREWKDSLFELGMLLHESGRYEEAIGTLEEAIERYPNDKQRLVAQYELGESYRRWAQGPIEQAKLARTQGERKKQQRLASDRLTTALKHFEKVQVSVTFKSHDIHSDPLLRAMLRNCYMLEGTVLFDLGQYNDAIEAYSNVASLYPDDPFVLETFVQISNCWRRLDRIDNARGAVKQAQIVLDGLPPTADFSSTTALNREEWRSLLADMERW